MSYNYKFYVLYSSGYIYYIFWIKPLSFFHSVKRPCSPATWRWRRTESDRAPRGIRRASRVACAKRYSSTSYTSTKTTTCTAVDITRKRSSPGVRLVMRYSICTILYIYITIYYVQHAAFRFMYILIHVQSCRRGGRYLYRLPQFFFSYKILCQAWPVFVVHRSKMFPTHKDAIAILP